MGAGRLSSERLGRMRAVMAGHVDCGHAPGIVTAVSRRGEVHIEAFGEQAQGGPAMGRDTIFRIASMSKPVVAAAAMILVEECRLRLDEPVDEWLPELADRRVLRRLDGPLDDTVPAQRSISLRDLLTSRMGFGQLMAQPDAYPILRAGRERQIDIGPPTPAAVPAPDEWMRGLGELPLMRQPGEAWLYNTALDVLGVLVARAAGQPLEQFLRERIFEPLGMRDTGFSVPPDKQERFAACYAADHETGEQQLYDAPDGQWSRPPAFPSGAGGLVSTADDYLAFGQMLLGNGRHGGVRILSRPAVELMTTDQLTPEQRAEAADFLGPSSGWGFGMAITIRRDDLWAVPGRYGWDGGLGTSWRSDPAEQLVGVLLTQQAWTSPQAPAVWQDFWTSVYQAIDD
ncbi:MAG TPA: serine hydrolase domain-containing protein [Roseiflexaceae bacterium]|nr:serine hydrolase domain-containing protein [Roseiflexaceae bacterium]